MTESTGKSVAVLLLRDRDGNLFLLDEAAIRACRATPEQQEALSKAVGDQDVSGYAAGGFNVLPELNIVVAPQTVVNTGIQLAVLSPGAQQSLTQVGGNSLFAFQR
jgi:hypothetical protein